MIDGEWVKEKGNIKMTEQENPHFKKGFKLTRIHIDQDGHENHYSAVSVTEGWLREDEGVVYPTLDTLNFSIDGKLGVESIQGVWKYKDEKGEVKGVETLDKGLKSIRGRGALI